VVTGSLSISAKREVETFPGRRGGGKTLLMLPLPFPRYVELFNVHLPRGDLGFVLSNYQAYNQFIPTLNDLLERYEVTGEFPNAIRDLLRTGGSHQKFPMMYSATSSDLFPALKGEGSPRS
jgi:predicted AAA+ superfamily ATPase